jgi:hypothetical protein
MVIQDDFPASQSISYLLIYSYTILEVASRASTEPNEALSTVALPTSRS